ncbi:xanthine dehydrogenase family protein subunit M [Actinomycetospora sp. TBRC 11914]|uniref:FAD binding domain-containing protein n=1 Tax=Actinomycetospora sp. TBRC 11914 TaxID=2729387 RepID=UPI00145D9A30|nr:FAD binding domain-containing protein [Actinomycetospora sp. TBRC 11914]NMO88570.1 xanthine dehydrogenase family protein subunit M [Actinomycetospora sp. TBRC 11914]
MKCPPFEYHRATSVDDAVAALAAAEDSKILAGGQSLVPVLALRLARPTVLVDVNRIPGLDGLDVRDGVLHAGALVRHAALARQALHPLAAAAAASIGHAAIRSRGTLGGSLAHADPAAELPAVLRACDGAVVVAGPDGTRRVGADALFVGALQTDLAEPEMITGVELGVPDAWGFAEFARRHGDFAVVSVAAARFGDRLRVVVGGVAGVPHLLETSAPSGTGALDEVAGALADDVDPSSDLHGSAGHRRALTRELARRALADVITEPAREPT